MNSATALTARETDEQLAALYHRYYDAQDKVERFVGSVKSIAGADYYYRGRQRVTDLTLAEATERLTAELAKHPDDGYGYGRLGAPCSGSSSVGNARKALAGLAEWEKTATEIEFAIDALEATYTGWSRFFLVVSSAGHIHSSMHCSTCRPTTRYGWLPQLSDSTEAEAVASHGPTLCSVCFPTAPVDWTTGKKLTANQAARAAA